MPQMQFMLNRENTVDETYINLGGDIDTFRIETKVNLYSLNIILINLKYSIPISTNLKMFFTGGPFVNIALFSNNKVYANFGDIKPVEGTSSFVNKIDYGLNIGYGLTYKSFILNLSTDFEFYRKKYSKGTVDNMDFEFESTTKSTIYKLSVGYKI